MSFDGNVVLAGVDLTVARGTVFALLGPNGAGKTTIVRILTTLLAPDHGEIHVAGHDVARDAHAVRAAIGLTGQFSAVDELLTGRENLMLMADLHHLARDRRAAADRRAARAFRARRCRRPPGAHLLGRDAPPARPGDDADRHPRGRSSSTSRRPGLDPRSRRTTWEIVRGLVADGTTVFLTTQYLEEADELADRVAILDRGLIVAQGSAERAQAADPGRAHRSELHRRRHTARGRRRAAHRASRRQCAHPPDPDRRERRDASQRPARSR